MTAPHRYSCPLRWGDLDMLGHTNNVRYVDYVQAARLALLADAGFTGLDGVAPGAPGADAGEQVVVVRHELSFDAPLMFREAPVTVLSRVAVVGAATATVEHVVLDEPGSGPVPTDGEPLVYFRARTEICVLDRPGGAPRRLTQAEQEALAAYGGTLPQPLPPGGPVPAETPGSTTPYAVQVRWGDVDPYGHVGNVEYVEYLQEARLRMLGLERWAGHGAPEPSEGRSGGESFDNLLVVAATTLDYVASMTYRREAYEVRSWVSRIGGKSFDVSSVIVDPGSDGAPVVLARGRVVLVAFDASAQRSTDLTDRSRAFLERLRG